MRARAHQPRAPHSRLPQGSPCPDGRNCADSFPTERVTWEGGRCQREGGHPQEGACVRLPRGTCKTHPDRASPHRSYHTSHICSTAKLPCATPHTARADRSPHRSRDTRPLSDATKHSQTTHRKNGRYVARGGRPVAEDVCINLVGPTDRDKVACTRFDGGARSPARRRARVSANYLGQHKKSVWVWVCEAHRGTRCS